MSDYDDALHELLINMVGKEAAVTLKEKRKMDVDVKLDREILAKIHNEVKIQSNRMDYMDSKIKFIIDQLVDHVNDGKPHEQHNIRKCSDEYLKTLGTSVLKVEFIDDSISIKDVTSMLGKRNE